MTTKATGGKRQAKPAIRSIPTNVAVFITTWVHHILKKRCHDRIKELTGEDLWYEVVPSALFKRCYKLALADFYSRSEKVTTSVGLMQSLADWTILDLPDLVDDEFMAPDVDRFIWRHIARSYQALVFENIALKGISTLPSASSPNLERCCVHHATSEAA